MRKAIVMCAGKSTRTHPLTLNKPKPLLKILDKTVLENTILALIKNNVDQIILVLGFGKELIKEYVKKEISGKIKNENNKVDVIFVEQEKQKGTGHAVLQCSKEISKNDELLILNGDDVYSSEDITNLVKNKSGALAQKVKNPEDFGIFVVDKKSKFKDLIEKPKELVGDMANIGCYFVNGEIMNILKRVKISERGEIELVDAIKEFAEDAKNDFKVVLVKNYWLPLVYPWSYLEANVFMLNKLIKLNPFIRGKVSEKATIKGKVILGENSIVEEGAVIEGPVYIGKNVVIGPNAYIRKDTIIMDNCKFRGEIFDSVLMDNTVGKHNCYIGHSVLGENCNIGAGTITSDYRHDGKSHITLVNGKKINSGRRKLGSFWGDNVCSGIGTLIYPGRKLWAETSTLPGEIVKEDKKKINE